MASYLEKLELIAHGLWARGNESAAAAIRSAASEADAQVTALRGALTECGSCPICRVTDIGIAEAHLSWCGVRAALSVQPEPRTAKEEAVDKRQRGLYEKFTVTRTDGQSAPGMKHDGCCYFVLDATHDPHARAALFAYAASCEAEYGPLAADVRRLAESAPLPDASAPPTCSGEATGDGSGQGPDGVRLIARRARPAAVAPTAATPPHHWLEAGGRKWCCQCGATWPNPIACSNAPWPRSVADSAGPSPVAPTAGQGAAPPDFRVLASAMRKMLPPALLAEVIAHLDPLTPFVAFLKETADDAR